MCTFKFVMNNYSQEYGVSYDINNEISDLCVEEVARFVVNTTIRLPYIERLIIQGEPFDDAINFKVQGSLDDHKEDDAISN